MNLNFIKKKKSEYIAHSQDIHACDIVMWVWASMAHTHITNKKWNSYVGFGENA